MTTISTYVWRWSSTFKSCCIGLLPHCHSCLVLLFWICYPARACAARGKVCPKILRWRELATFRTSERIRFENAPILLTCTCHWAHSLPLSGISAVFLLSGPLCQPCYLRPPVTPTNYMPRVHFSRIYGMDLRRERKKEARPLIWSRELSWVPKLCLKCNNLDWQRARSTSEKEKESAAELSRLKYRAQGFRATAKS